MRSVCNKLRGDNTARCLATILPEPPLSILPTVSFRRILQAPATVQLPRRWQCFFKITIPCLIPTIITLTILAVGKIFNSDFGLFYQVPMNSGAIMDVTQTIDTYVYRGLMNTANMGMSAAACFYQSIVGFCLVMLTNSLVRKISKENAMF